MQRELVISSDDLGMTLSVNHGIEAALQKNALTSTNFMVPCPWFELAAQSFRGADLDLGVHLTLTCEWQTYKWRPLTSGKSLLDGSGHLYRNIRELMDNATAGDIHSECRQQIATALARGLPIIYADLHMCIPTFAQDAAGIRLVNPDYELAAMRIVDTVVQEFELHYPYALTEGRLKHFRSALSISGKSKLEIENYLRSLEPGAHHLSCHCALASDEQDQLAQRGTHDHAWALTYRTADLECITSEWFRDLLQSCEIQLSRMPFSPRRAADAREAAQS